MRIYFTMPTALLVSVPSMFDVTFRRTMETPEAQRIRPLVEPPNAPVRKVRRRLFGDYVHVQFAEMKFYVSGHIECNTGRRAFERCPDVDSGDDFQTLCLDYLHAGLLKDLDETGCVFRAAKYDNRDVLFHQIVLIKIT